MADESVRGIVPGDKIGVEDRGWGPAARLGVAVCVAGLAGPKAGGRAGPGREARTCVGAKGGGRLAAVCGTCMTDLHLFSAVLARQVRLHTDASLDY